MVGILGLLTGWALLMPAFLMLFLSFGGPYQRWMSFFLGISASIPMLAFMTIGGLVVIAFSVRQLAKRAD
jgi:hypothetical protein